MVFYFRLENLKTLPSASLRRDVTWKCQRLHHRPCTSLSASLANQQAEDFKISITPFPLLSVLFPSSFSLYNFISHPRTPLQVWGLFLVFSLCFCRVPQAEDRVVFRELWHMHQRQDQWQRLQWAFVILCVRCDIETMLALLSCCSEFRIQRGHRRHGRYASARSDDGRYLRDCLIILYEMLLGFQTGLGSVARWRITTLPPTILSSFWLKHFSYV